MIATIATITVGLGACKGGSKATPAARTGPVQEGELGRVVARVDDSVITLGDVQDGINKQAPFVRARYTSPEKRKEYLDSLIRIEVMAKEAARRGYEKDPEVVRVMKQQMISKFLHSDFESKLKVEDVPDADVEKYYKAHPEDFNRPDQVHVSEIVVKDKAKAEKVAREANAASKTDPKPFRDLVAKYSEDADSKSRGGDVAAFDRETSTLPKPVVEAAFAMKEPGEISAPIATDNGFVVLRLMAKIPGFSKPLPEVKRQIQRNLFRDLRTKAMDEFVADLRKKYTVTIDEAALAKVTVNSGMGAGGPGMPGGMPHPMPPQSLGQLPGATAAVPTPGPVPPPPAAAPAAKTP
jgi:peptidyl-prolyl cis-trans isomerase C